MPIEFESAFSNRRKIGPRLHHLSVQTCRTFVDHGMVYVNSHLRAADGRDFSMFAAFFRVDVTTEGETRSVHF